MVTHERMDTTFPFLNALFYHNIFLLSKDAKEATGMVKESPPEIEPSPVDPGVSHPHGYEAAHHVDHYHYENRTCLSVIL